MPTDSNAPEKGNDNGAGKRGAGLPVGAGGLGGGLLVFLLVLLLLNNFALALIFALMFGGGVEVALRAGRKKSG